MFANTSCNLSFTKLHTDPPCNGPQDSGSLTFMLRHIIRIFCGKQRLTHICKYVWVLAWTVACLHPVTAQTSPITRRDPKAVQILQRMELISGWNSQLRDISASYAGTLVSMASANEPTAFHLRAMLGHRLRLDAGQASVLVNGHIGSVQDAGGHSSRMTRQNFGSMVPSLMPMFTVLQDWRQPSSRLIHLGTYSAGSDFVDVIRIDELDAEASPRVQDPSQSAIFRVSRSTGLPLSISVLEAASSTTVALNRISYEWSDYRAVGNIMLPGTTTKKSAATQLVTFTLQNAHVNTGLSSSIFATAQSY